MIKKHCLLLICILAVAEAWCQNDSVLVARAKWSTKKLATGVWWKQVHYTDNKLFGASQNINVVEISAGARHVELNVVHSDSLELTSHMAEARGALAGINGSFFKMRGPDPDYRKDLNGVPKPEPSKIDRNRSQVYLRENDSIISPNIPYKTDTRKRHQQASIAIDDEKLFIVKGDSLDLKSEDRIVAHDVLSTGPLMALAGIGQPIPNDAFCNERHPRTAIGKKADGTVVLLVVDGRAAESAGMSIPELKQLMQWLGCVDAINLDGGGSSTMYIKGQPYHGVVNCPTDNKKFDHEGEREVANAILLLPK